MEPSGTQEFIKSEVNESMHDVPDLILFKDIKQEIVETDIFKLTHPTDDIKEDCTSICRKIFSNQIRPFVKIENSEAANESSLTNNISLKSFKVKNEELDLKEEDLEFKADSTLPTQEEHNVSTMEQYQQELIIQKYKFKCDQCTFQSMHRKSLKIHLLRHQNPEEVEMFKCNQCDFQTIYKNYLNKHLRHHKNPEEVDMFKCDQCAYQTTQKSYLKRHLLRHRNPEEVDMFKCDQCEYQATQKGHLKAHLLRHRDPEEEKKFKCDQCNFRTLAKSHLKRHKNPGEVVMFKCGQCDCKQFRREKRASLTIQQKIDILDKLENGQKNRSICKEYNLSSSTVSTIFKKKNDIRKLYIELQTTHGNPKRRKTNRSPTLRILDETVYRWVRQERECGKLISGIILREKARAFYALLKENGQIPDGTAEFKATNGWLQNFYERHGIRRLQVKGEKTSANQEASESFITKFKQLLIDKNIELDDVYNADETGLLYRSLPNRTLVLADEKEAAGDKSMKERLTVMVCANASGSQKIPPLVIGKSLKPRCFENKTIPLDYVAQKKALMTSELFLHWFKDVFLKNVREIKPNAKILLVLDSASTHPCAEQLRRLDKNCEIAYLPPNVTSLIQPMDQGVISALKRHYKTAFLREVNSRQFDNHNAVIKFVKSWDVLACMHILKDAWFSLTERTLRNAWKKLLPDIASNAIEVPPLNNELVRLLDRVPGGNYISSSEVDDWLLEEDTVPTFEEPNDHQLVESVIAPEQLADNVEANTEEEDTSSLSISENENEEMSKKSPHDLLSAAQYILSWPLETMNLSQAERSTLLKIRDYALDMVMDL